MQKFLTIFTLNTPYTVWYRVSEDGRRCTEIDKHNGNSMWADTIANKMKNVQVAFNPPNGYQFV